MKGCVTVVAVEDECAKAAILAAQSTFPKGGNRFSEKIVLKKVTSDGFDST
jgi:hypothetical protein